MLFSSLSSASARVLLFRRGGSAFPNVRTWNKDLIVPVVLDMTDLKTKDYIPETGTVTMFTTSWCGYCRNLKKAMDADGIGYREVNIEDVEGTAEIVEEFNGGNQTVPTLIFSDGSAVTNPRIEQVRERL